MKKRLLALLLGCAMIIGAFGSFAPTAHATESGGTCGEGFSYTFDSETGALTITQTGTDGYMDSWFFQDETDIRSAVFNEGITVVCNGTFVGCTSLTTVTLPQSLEEIESSVFSGTDNLKDVYYGERRNSGQTSKSETEILDWQMPSFTVRMGIPSIMRRRKNMITTFPIS